MRDARVLTPPALERRLADLSALVQVIKQINRSLDPENVLHTSLEGIRQFAGGEFGCFLLLQNNASALALKNAEGLSAPLLAQLQKISPPETSAEVLPENQAALLAEIGHRVGQVLGAQAIQSSVILPLMARGRAIGILVVGAGKVLTPLGIDLLMSIGEQIGMAIENARLHAALAESEEWHRAFIENSPDGFWETDADGRILYVNESASKILGYPRAELLKMRREHLLAMDRTGLAAFFENLRQHGFLANEYGKIRIASGEIRTFNFTMREVRDARGEIVRRQAIFRDVTEHLKVLDQLRQRTEEQAALNTIAGILNHPLEIARSLDQVCEQIVSITGMESVAMYLLNEAAQRIDLLAQRGLSSQLLAQGHRLGLDDLAVSTIINDGKIIALDEVVEFPDATSFAGPRAEGYHAGIGVPILRRGVPAGAIYVGSKVKTRYEQSDVALLQNIANQIGVALENADLYTQMQRRMAELEGLAQLSAACATQYEPQAICRLAVTQTKELFAANVCVLRLVENDQLVLGAGLVDAKAALHEKMDLDPFRRQVLEHRLQYMVGDAESDQVSEDHRKEFRRVGLRSFLAVPLVAQERNIGLVAIGHSQPHKWLPSEIDLLQTIANQVGTVLENARLFAQTRQRVQELDGLARISTALVANLDPRAVAEVAVEATQKLLGVDVVDLSLLQEGKLYRMAARINHSGVPLSAPIVLGELIVPLVERREPLIVHDIAQATAPALARALMAPRGLRSLLVVPLVTREQVIGMLAVVHSQARIWTSQEQNLLQTIANQVASAMDNAQLYQNALTEKRKVQAIFDSGLSGLFATDAAGRIVMFNRAAERITGWTLAEVEGKSWREILSDHAVGNAVESLMEQALLHKQTTYAFEGRKMRTKDGRVIPVAKASAPLLDEKENVIGAVGAFWDLSKEQRAEIEYENFLTMIAHQLRSPLSSVLSALDLFERRNLSDARRAELWTIIKAEGSQLKRLADQFLEHETALKSARPVNLETLSVARVARQLVRQFRSNHHAHHFQVRVPNPEPWALADSQGIENVLRNLLDNAVIYSPPDSRINIRINAPDPDWIVVSVQDFGIGIPLSEQPHLFKPFYRVPQTSERRVYGHGLGLPLAKEMIDAMGGKIWVESEAGQGATFCFTLRRAR